MKLQWRVSVAPCQFPAEFKATLRNCTPWNDHASSSPSISNVNVIGVANVVAFVFTFTQSMLSLAALLLTSHEAAPPAAILAETNESMTVDLYAGRLSDKYGREYPVYVTENGTCDNTDSFRPRFIYDQLKLVSETDNRIERYYHWCFTDNFEWREGESARFGIVHLDYETQKRTVKNSGTLYTSIIKNCGVTDEAYEKYVEKTNYKK